MFEASPHAAALQALDIRLCERARKIRVFRKILEIASVQRVALDVHAGREQDVHVVFDAVVGERLTHEAGALRAPRVGKALHGGIGDGGHDLHFAVLIAIFLAQPDGPVRNGDAGQLPAEIGRVPKAVAANEAELFRRRKVFYRKSFHRSLLILRAFCR